VRVILAIVLLVTLICGGFFFLETPDISLRELPHAILIKDNPEDLKKGMEALFAEASKMETQFNDLKSGRTKKPLTSDMVKSVKVRMDLLYRNDPNNTKAKEIGDKLDGILVEVDRKNEVNRPIEARNKYAQNLEVTMLRAGRDMTIRATEKSSTTLEIKYVLMNPSCCFSARRKRTIV
jgi:hypothetical protein